MPVSEPFVPTVTMPLLAAARPVEGQGWIGHWSPGIGDPSVMGWVTVALYLVAAWLCFLCSRRSRVLARRGSDARWEPRLWGLFALFLLALGINKQLDLQSAFTEVMRVVAREQGWYEARRQYQYAFIGAVAVLAAFAGTALIAAAWRLGRALKLAALGLRREGGRGPEGGLGAGEGPSDRQEPPVQIERDEKGWPRAFWELAGSAPDFDLGDRTAAHERGDVLNGPTADPSRPGRRGSLRMTSRRRILRGRADGSPSG
jgi:hypothetical protein